MSKSQRQRAFYLEKEFISGGLEYKTKSGTLKTFKNTLKTRLNKVLEQKNGNSDFKRFCQLFVQTREFKFFMMLVIVFNTILICIELGNASYIGTVLNAVLMGIYIFEFLVKVYSDWLYFTKSGYDLFDVIILFISLVDMLISSGSTQTGLLKVFRSLRAVRLFRSVGFIRKLRLIINALGKTLRNSVLNVAILLVLMMFIFSILGYYLYGTGPFKVNEFSSIKNAFFSLFRYVTAESWMGIQKSLTKAGYQGSEWFSVSFLFIGNLVLSNLFIGVICENIDEATAADEEEQENNRYKVQESKKKLLFKKQEEDMKKLFKTQNQEFNATDVDAFLETIAGNLVDTEALPMRHFYFQPTWLNTCLVSLNYEMLLMLKQQQERIRLMNLLKELQDVTSHE